MSGAAGDSSRTQAYWDGVYSRRAHDEVSWHEPVPVQSLEWIAATGVARDAPLIDVGGGASTLADELLARGHSDVTVLDVSPDVLARVADRLKGLGLQANVEASDVTGFAAPRPYALWHDRAVFHFLTTAEGRAGYVAALLRATQPGSHVLIATFGPQGPVRCSGLPTARYDERQLAAELGPQFQLTRSAIDVHITPSGATQQFLRTHFLRK